MNLVVFQGNMVLENCIPLLQDNLIPLRSGLCSDQLLQIANSIGTIALHPHLLSQTIITCDLQHHERCKAKEFKSLIKTKQRETLQ